METAFNHALAEQLRARHPRWRERIGEADALAAEQTGVFDGAPSLRPDIVVRQPGGAMVAIETEFMPAAGVEYDAGARLGLKSAGAAVESALAVRVPAVLRESQAGLPAAIAVARFEFCLFSLDGEGASSRWPEAGWLRGGLDRLAGAVEAAAVTEARLASAADALQAGIAGAATNLRSHLHERPDMFSDMASTLCQEDGAQTTRMAAAIVANAFVFQSAIAGNHGIPDPSEMRRDGGRIHKSDVVSQWERILRINYWPIFAIARDLLRSVPSAVALSFLDRMAGLAEELEGMGASAMQDLSGQMFQKLIADRKFLATFYTLPSSSALLAGLGAARLEADWTDIESVGRLRIGDFACGTGSLLAAARREIDMRFRRAGSDDRALHAAMMERIIVAADIMPAATHLTASMLSSAHPGTPFADTKVYRMAYGEANGRVRIGSLDLIEQDLFRPLLSPEEARRAGGGGEERVAAQDAAVPRESFHLVIMNPPFTRPTNHETAGVPNPSFAGFSTTDDEQAAMSLKLKRVRAQLLRQYDRPGARALAGSYPAGHGNAGLASNFIDLADTKLRDGGCLALVLPASFAGGASWEGARRLLAERYRNIVIVAIAAHGSTDRAFSADTGMAELLVVATRRGEGLADPGETALVVSLRRRPKTVLEGTLAAAAIGRLPAALDSGVLSLGDGVEPAGSWMRAPLPEACAAAAIAEAGLAGIGRALGRGELRLPRLRPILPLPIAPLGALGQRGPIDRDVGNRRDEAPPHRGPFRIRSLAAGEYPDYPILWAHSAGRERRIAVHPDCRGDVRPGCDEKALDIWETAARLHFNRDFRLNSQSLAACLTPEPAIGGRAWPSFRLDSEEWLPIIALWANSTLGLISFWWAGTRQQQGRSVLTVARLPRLRVLDPRELPPAKLARADDILQEFLETAFLPANECYRDPARLDLDRRLLVDLLDLPEDVLEPLRVARLQWCSEPSVHGGKTTRPGGD